jgi:hypothetical protein
VAHKGQWAAAEDLNVSWKWNVGQVHEALAGRLVPAEDSQQLRRGGEHRWQKYAVISSACAAAGAPAQCPPGT